MLLTELEVINPSSLQETLQILGRKRERVMVVAGGTDLIIQLKDGKHHPEALVNIEPLSEMRYVREEKGEVHIGALSSFTDIIESPIVEKLAPVLQEASRTIGAMQIQNRGTIGGNICNASPAADSVPVLYALGTTVLLRSEKGRREVPIELFFRGYREKDIQPNEIVEEVKFKGMTSRENASYVKLGLRNANAISIVSAAIWVEWAENRDRFSRARVALGAVAPTVVRARKTEHALIGTSLDDGNILEATRTASTECSPISDIRASAKYRSAVVPNLVYKGIRKIAGGR